MCGCLHLSVMDDATNQSIRGIFHFVHYDAHLPAHTPAGAMETVSDCADGGEQREVDSCWICVGFLLYNTIYDPPLLQPAAHTASLKGLCPICEHRPEGPSSIRVNDPRTLKEQRNESTGPEPPWGECSSALVSSRVVVPEFLQSTKVEFNHSTD